MNMSSSSKEHAVLEMLRRGSVLFGDENLASLANDGDRAPSSGVTIEEIDDNDDDLQRQQQQTTEAPDREDSVDERDDHTGALILDDADDATVQQAVVQLATEAERMKACLAEQEQVFRRESEFVEHLRREHKALKELASDYKHRARLRRRVERAEHDAKRVGRSNSTSKRRLKKQARLLRQTRREATQSLELLQSKNVNYEMELEHQMTELRREHEVNFFLM